MFKLRTDKISRELEKNLELAADLAIMVTEFPDRITPEVCKNKSDFHKMVFAFSMATDSESMPWETNMRVISRILHEYFALVFLGKMGPEPGGTDVDKGKTADFFATSTDMLRKMGVPTIENEDGSVEFDYEQMRKAMEDKDED